MSLIIDTVAAYLPPRRKATPSGWISFNAVCCHHNGTSADQRSRGGVMLNEGVSYHCFNCGFKASWQPGRTITVKFKKLLQWLNVGDDIISKCSIEALRLKENTEYKGEVSLIPVFIDKALPMGSKPIIDWIDTNPPEMHPVLEYLYNRGFTVDDYNWHWTDEDGFQNRLIIPFYNKGKIVGYTARSIRDSKVKYISEQQPGYVFNLDSQGFDKEFVLVTEGPIDAICLGSCAVMSNEIGDQQVAQLKSLQKEIVIVPDRDKSGLKLVEQAIELGFSVSMPEWPEGVKDVNDCMRQHGRLYTMWSIVSAKEHNTLKNQLRMKKWIGLEN